LPKAGSGKTFALAAAREVWEASGQVVIGAAVARRAVGPLEDSSGIPSTSVAALLAELAGRPRGLPLAAPSTWRERSDARSAHCAPAGGLAAR
jgi:hypothetical protein